MSTIITRQFGIDFLAQLEVAGRAGSREALKVAMASVVSTLQAGYKGALERMAPTGVDATPETWNLCFVRAVLACCDRHNRTEEQVNEALKTVLGQA